jgi:hypothetical protein
MAQAGYCSECGAYVWLAEGGACANGHAAEGISGAYEVPEPVVASSTDLPDSTESTQLGLLGRIRDALGGPAEALKPAEIELRQAEIEYAQVVRAAEKNLKSVTKAADHAVRDAEKSLSQARTYGTRSLGAYGGVVAYEHAVQTPQGTINLEVEQASASVDTAGALMETRRSTLTRMAAGGLLLGGFGMLAGGQLQKSRMMDTRELYLLIESPSVASMVQCNPNDGPQIRQLANAINMASRGAPARAAERAKSVEQWTQHVQSLRQTREMAVGQALAGLEAARGDARRIDAARQAAGVAPTGESE